MQISLTAAEKFSTALWGCERIFDYWIHLLIFLWDRKWLALLATQRKVFIFLLLKTIGQLYYFLDHSVVDTSCMTMETDNHKCVKWIMDSILNVLAHWRTLNQEPSANDSSGHFSGHVLHRLEFETEF